MFTWITPQMQPIIWLVLGVILAVVEGFTIQLTAIWFAIGAAAAAIAAIFGASGWPQIWVFLLVSAATLIFTRPLLQRALQVKKVSTNADAVIGKIGVVIHEIDNDLAVGRISVSGLDWSARAMTDQLIPVGEKVRVIAIDGVKLMVESYTQV